MRPHLPPLGILYISKILENNGHKVEVIDCNAESLSRKKIRRKLNNCDVVGLTTLTSIKDREFSINLTKTIKEIDNNIPLIVGGPHSTVLPKVSIKEHNADICVTGQAEPIMKRLADAIEGKRSFSTIPGLIYKSGKQYRKTKPGEIIKNLDDVPFPSRHLVEKYEYGYAFDVKFSKGKLTSFITSRGCPYHCTFCSLRSVFPDYKERSIKNVCEEIDELIDQGYKTIVFNDDNFIVNKKRTEKIMDYIISKDADLALWIYDARADSYDRKLFEKMKKAGVEMIYLGIESGNQDILDYYNKKLRLSEVYKTVKLCKEMGFFVMANFIFGAPIETKMHIEKTIKFARSLPIDLANFYILCYQIGSKIRETAVKEGKLKKDDIYAEACSEKGLSNFTQKELEEFVLRAQKTFFMNPRLWAREVFYSMIKQNFNNLKLGLRYIKNSS
jgi:anaerobic magnesium-protoporphyrin IX monomethyl ester cyclase